MAGRPLGTANTTGWRYATIGFRPLILRELDREAKRRKLSRSRVIQDLVEACLREAGKDRVIERAKKRSYGPGRARLTASGS